jgi:hypothetical protein
MCGAGPFHHCRGPTLRRITACGGGATSHGADGARQDIRSQLREGVSLGLPGPGHRLSCRRRRGAHHGRDRRQLSRNFADLVRRTRRVHRAGELPRADRRRRQVLHGAVAHLPVRRGRRADRILRRSGHRAVAQPRILRPPPDPHPDHDSHGHRADRRRPDLVSLSSCPPSGCLLRFSTTWVCSAKWASFRRPKPRSPC